MKASSLRVVGIQRQIQLRLRKRRNSGTSGAWRSTRGERLGGHPRPPARDSPCRVQNVQPGQQAASRYQVVDFTSCLHGAVPTKACSRELVDCDWIQYYSYRRRISETWSACKPCKRCARGDKEQHCADPGEARQLPRGKGARCGAEGRGGGHQGPDHTQCCGLRQKKEIKHTGNVAGSTQKLRNFHRICTPIMSDRARASSGSVTWASLRYRPDDS